MHQVILGTLHDEVHLLLQRATCGTAQDCRASLRREICEIGLAERFLRVVERYTSLSPEFVGGRDLIDFVDGKLTEIDAIVSLAPNFFNPGHSDNVDVYFLKASRLKIPPTNHGDCEVNLGLSGHQIPLMEQIQELEGTLLGKNVLLVDDNCSRRKSTLKEVSKLLISLGVKLEAVAVGFSSDSQAKLDLESENSSNGSIALLALRQRSYSCSEIGSTPLKDLLYLNPNGGAVPMGFYSNCDQIEKGYGIIIDHMLNGEGSFLLQQLREALNQIGIEANESFQLNLLEELTWEKYLGLFDDRRNDPALHVDKLTFKIVDPVRKSRLYPAPYGSSQKGLLSSISREEWFDFSQELILISQELIRIAEKVSDTTIPARYLPISSTHSTDTGSLLEATASELLDDLRARVLS